MNNHKLLMSILFFTMAILQQLGVIYIDSQSVFGLSLGSLLISISTCYNGYYAVSIYNTNKSINIVKLTQRLIYSLGFMIMFIVTFINENKILDDFMNKMDENTLLLLAISATYLSMNITNFRKKKENAKNKAGV